VTADNQIRNQIANVPRWRSQIEDFDSANKTGVGVKCKVRDSTRLMYVNVVAKFAKHMEKPLEAIAEQDVKNYVSRITNKYTQRGTCAVIKKFLKFVGREDLSAKVSVPNITIDERLDDIDRVYAEDVRKLLTAEDNARNQALIALMYESAGRLGEILALKIRDVQTDEYGVIVKLFGKTKLRNVRLVAAAPYVQRWLQLHNFKNTPKTPLFYSIYHGNLKALGKTMTAKIIWKAAEKAGFKGEDLKRFHPHAFRHGRLSELGHDLTDSEMKHVGGWTDRRMISLYSKVDEDRVNNKLLMLQGLTIQEEQKVSALQVKACPKCKHLNASTDLYCSVCGVPLTKEGEKALREREARIERLEKEVADTHRFLGLDQPRTPEVVEILENLKAAYKRAYPSE